MSLATSGRKGFTLSKNILIVIISMSLSFVFYASAYPSEFFEIIQSGKAKENIMKYEEKARALEAEGKLKKASTAYIETSKLARSSGNYQKGILYGTKAIELGEKTNSPEIQARASLHTAKSYIAVGDHERALLLLEKAESAAAHLVGEEGLQINIYVTAVHLYKKSANPEKALVMQKRAFEFYENIMNVISLPSGRGPVGQQKLQNKFHKSGFKRNFIDLMVTLGDAYAELGDDKAALSLYDKALSYAKDIKSHVSKVRVSMGDFYFKKGDFQKALGYHKKVCSSSVIADHPNSIVYACSNAARDYSMLGKPEKAVEHYKIAIDTIEDLRSMLQSAEMRSSFFEQMTKTYDGMISTLMAIGKAEEAFDYSERAKARTFLDILGSKVDLSKGSVTALSEEEMELKRKMASLQLKLEDDDSIDITKELTEMKKQYDEFLIKLKKENLEHAALISVETLTLRDVQAMLGQKKTLLEFHVLADKTILWIVKKDIMRSVIIEHGGKSLVKVIKTLRDAISNISPEDRDRKQLKNLYTVFFKDAGIEKGEELVIVPHDMLHYLPFHSLITPEDRYLIEDHVISYLSSASLMKFIKDKRKGIGEDVLAFGNPDLKNPVYDLEYAEKEAEEIAKIFPRSKILLKKEATESKAKDLSNRYKILHFASHAEFNKQIPEDTSLKLTKDEKEDGNLSVEEIFRLNINASLVVLSACETEIGGISRGDEIIGLTRAFIYAGTPSIITTLWKVNDKATYLLMKDFYRNLRTMRKADALRTAQLNIMKDYPHPFFWGAFVLTGDTE